MCAAGYDHEAVKDDPAAWAELEFVGFQFVFDDEPGLCLKNCRCGSTICKDAEDQAEARRWWAEFMKRRSA